MLQGLSTDANYLICNVYKLEWTGGLVERGTDGLTYDKADSKSSLKSRN
jgi:hypothetical protein